LITQDRARSIIEGVSWDYGFAYELMSHGKVPRWVESPHDPGLDPDILKALERWKDRPELPQDVVF
jgi:hypothetical protein